jgi:DNA-binding ferritin-like protein
MITTSPFNLDLLPTRVKNRDERDTPTFSVLLYDFKIFKKEVVQFCSSYQGPDYFDFLKHLSELRLLVDSFIKELEVHFSDLNKSNFESLSNSLKFSLEKRQVLVSTDIEKNANVVIGLGNLIQSCRKASMEASKTKDHVMESLLTGFVNEMEKSHWIFSMFSKY